MKLITSHANRLVMTAMVITSLLFCLNPLAFAAETVTSPAPSRSAAASPSSTAARPAPGTQRSEPKAEAEAKSEETKSVNPQVQFEVEKKAAERRAQLTKDALAAIDETRKALTALEAGKQKEALAALERVTGKLDLIVAREPALALAPVGVSTIIRDLYSNVDTVKGVVRLAQEYLDDGKVQEARGLLTGLASEAETQVSNIPLATYPAAIKSVVPLIDAGKLDEAKTALRTALNTLVIESFVTPLPKIRAEAMLKEAEKIAEKSDRQEEENKKLKSLVESARHELELAEAIGYGGKNDYKPLYGQLDDIQSKTGGGKSGKGFFDKIKESLSKLVTSAGR